MRRLFLATLVAATGCASSADPGASNDNSATPNHHGIAASRTQVATAPGGGHDDGDDTRKFPAPRWVRSPATTSDAGQSDANVTEDAAVGDDASGVPSNPPTSPAWQPLTNQSQVFAAAHALLLTDGTVMVQAVYNLEGADLNHWWKLTPDVNGSYVNGTWTELAPMPNAYAPLYYASAVLPDGRVIIEGGEYQVIQGNITSVWQNAGAIYDPTKDSWTAVAPPTGWTFIGDAVSTVLADGRFLLSDDWSQTAILDPSTLRWTTYAATGKADAYNEEGWTLLPDGNVLTVDTNDFTNLTNSEILNPTTAAWSTAGSTIVKLDDTYSDESGSWEMGPQVLMPNGNVLAIGATGHTAVYSVAHASWTAGPDFPIIEGEGQMDVADGPAALRTSGTVLTVASPGIFESPAHIFESDGHSIRQLAEPPGAAYDSSYYTSLLLLPTGEILFTDWSNDVEIYPAADHHAEWLEPIIENGCDLERLVAGKTYRLDGQGLNGASQAVAYGDDAQMATNYPLVRIKNRHTGHVTYARTHDHSRMGVDINAHSHTFFDLPSSIETGASDLVVVANGIASDPISVTISDAR